MRVIETEVIQEQTDGRSFSLVLKSAPPSICASPYHQDLTVQKHY